MAMGEDTGFGMGLGGWLGVILLVALLGGGFGGLGGNNAAYATMADVNSAINNQSTQEGIRDILTANANNNFATANLINTQTNTMLQMHSADQVNLLQGFNALSAQIANQTNTLSSKLDNLGYTMDQCCCKIQTQMLQYRLDDATAKNVALQNDISNANQSLYLLSQLGTYTPGATGGTATAATGNS